MVKLKVKVIFIDDQMYHIIFMKELFKQVKIDFEVEIFTFTDAEEALEHIYQTGADIVVTDYQMPKLKGSDIIKALKKEKRFEDTLIVVVTAFDEEKVMKECLELGATDFLRKPVNKFEFIPKMQNLVKLAASIKLQKNQVLLLSHEIEKAIKEIKVREREIVIRLAKAAEHRDADTGNHILRVGEYTKLIAMSVGMDKDWVELVSQGALLHDVGKIAVPDAILLKPGKLNAEEWEIMKKHTIWGHKILSGSGIKLLEIAAEIALYHHEKWNGKGYPEGLKGESIPLSARMVAIADVFDAVTMKRPYKEPWPLEKAFELIEKEAGEHFDPELAKVFLKNKEKVKEIYFLLKE